MNSDDSGNTTGVDGSKSEVSKNSIINKSNINENNEENSLLLSHLFKIKSQSVQISTIFSHKESIYHKMIRPSDLKILSKKAQQKSLKSSPVFKNIAWVYNKLSIGWSKVFNLTPMMTDKKHTYT